MNLTIRPLTPDLRPALEDLFDTKGPCSRCWCMWTRIGSAYRRRPAARNKRDFRAVVERVPPRHGGAARCRDPGRKMRQGAGARGLPVRRRAVAQRLGQRLCLDLRPRRVQDRRPPRAGAADHAPRSPGNIVMDIAWSCRVPRPAPWSRAGRNPPTPSRAPSPRSGTSTRSLGANTAQIASPSARTPAISRFRRPAPAIPSASLLQPGQSRPNRRARRRRRARESMIAVSYSAAFFDAFSRNGAIWSASAFWNAGRASQRRI